MGNMDDMYDMNDVDNMDKMDNMCNEGLEDDEVMGTLKKRKRDGETLIIVWEVDSGNLLVP